MKRAILENLPRLLRGYGKTFQHVQESAVIVVVDADDRNCRNLKRELLAVLHHCRPAPRTLFRIAIEEGEAWLLGDMEAIKRAYPRAKERVLHSYVQDSICGTWETLADAIFPGGSVALKKLGYPQIGIVKCEWAEKITPHVQVERNRSKSFQVFRNGLLSLASVIQHGH